MESCPTDSRADAACQFSCRQVLPRRYALRLGILCGWFGAVIVSAVGLAAESPFVFRDVATEVGLLPDVGGIHAHGAAWGDIDGDGWLDLYVGTFHKRDGKPNLLFRNVAGRFRLDDQPVLRVSGRANGIVFADLDNDGDLDLYVSNLGGGSWGNQATESRLFRNDGGGRFTDVSKLSGARPAAFRGRGLCVLDYDGDAWLDLLLGEGVSYGSARRSRILRNLGQLRFEDVTDAVGLPPGIPGMGVAAADVNQDGWPDIFLTGPRGGNRLLLNDGRGRFHEAPGSPDTFSWTYTNPDDRVCGVAFGDVNRDGLPEIVLGQHFDHPWRAPRANRIYLHCGVTDGSPRYRDITNAAGFDPIPMKAPHVEIQDFDNDGWADVYTSVVKFANGVPHPLIYRNLGVGRGGVPRFREYAMAVNDFPSHEDQRVRRSGDFAARMTRERKIIYMSPGPSGDFDRDGRLDLFLGSWWPVSPSLLLHNETPGGHWLEVQVQGAEGVNRMGVGAKVRLYEAGRLGKPEALLGCQEVAVGYGYVSGQEAVAHFGLGQLQSCDVQVVLPHGQGVLTRRGVSVDQRINVAR